MTTPSVSSKRRHGTSLRKKRKSSISPSTLADNDKIMCDVTKSAQSKRRIVSETPIDDPLAEETWRPKRNRFSYFQGEELRKLMEPKNLGRVFAQIENNSPRDHKLTNSLIDNPDVYMLPTTPFVVASYGKYVLYNIDYKTLSENESLSNFLVDYVCNMFASERKDIQIETIQTK